MLDLSPYSKSIFDMVWRAKVSKKVRFFIWQVLLGHADTMERLVRKRTSLVDLFCCMLCQKAEEDLVHLFWDILPLCEGSVELFPVSVWCQFCWL